MSLEEADRTAAGVAVVPEERVSLADIERSIASEAYVDGREFIRVSLLRDGASQIGAEHEIGQLPGNVETLTICLLVLRNGFTIIGKSAPASPANYNPALGRKFAREDAIRQVWPLMGFLMREKLFQRDRKPVLGMADGSAFTHEADADVARRSGSGLLDAAAIEKMKDAAGRDAIKDTHVTFSHEADAEIYLGLSAAAKRTHADEAAAMARRRIVAEEREARAKEASGVFGHAQPLSMGRIIHVRRTPDGAWMPAIVTSPASQGHWAVSAFYEGGLICLTVTDVPDVISGRYATEWRWPPRV